MKVGNSQQEPKQTDSRNIGNRTKTKAAGYRVYVKTIAILHALHKEHYKELEEFGVMGQKWSQNASEDSHERVYTPEETLIYIRELLKLDKEFGQCIWQLFYGYLAYRMARLRKPDDLREAVNNPEFVRLSGSCADGGAICRWFRQGNLDMELDITYQVGTIPSAKEASVLENIAEKPGFLKLYNTRETLTCLHPIVRLNDAKCHFSHRHQASKKFVNTLDLVNHVSKVFGVTDDRLMGSSIPKIGSNVMGVDESASRWDYREEVIGPSLMMELNVSLRDQLAFSYSLDHVLAFKLEKIPDEIKPCLERLEGFLPSSVMTEVRRARTHVVAKKSPDAKTEEEWRHSTSEIEKILMRTWSNPGNDMKMVCYFTLKCLLYRHIRGIEVSNKYLPSYALKTKMFWMVETMESSEWTETNFMQNLRKILNSLMVDVKGRKIRNYFIPEMNLIDPSNYPVELTDAVAMKLKEIIDNLEAFLPKDLEKVIRKSKDVLIALKAITAQLSYKKVQADLKNGRISDFGETLQLINDTGFDLAGLIQGFLNMNTKGNNP